MNLELLSMLLKNLRIKKNLTTKQVEIRSNKKISSSHISLIENEKRKPSPFILKTLAEIYDYDYLKLYKLAGYIDDDLEKKSTDDFTFATHIANDKELSEEAKRDVLNYYEFIKQRNKNK